jgi:hypothetical protein
MHHLHPAKYRIIHVRGCVGGWVRGRMDVWVRELYRCVGTRIVYVRGCENYTGEIYTGAWVRE